MYDAPTATCGEDEARMSEGARCHTRICVCAVCTSMYRKERCTDVDTDAGTRMNTDTHMEYMFHTHTPTHARPVDIGGLLEAIARGVCRLLPLAAREVDEVEARCARLGHPLRRLVLAHHLQCARVCVYDLRDTHTHSLSHTQHAYTTYYAHTYKVR